MSVAPLLNVESTGLIAVASMAWRYRGNVRATVVVKAELSFADGLLTQVQARAPRADSEKAFFLTYAEVIFAGLHPQAEPARVAVLRGSEQVMGLDVDAHSSLGPGLAGRLSPFDQARSQYLGGISAIDLHQRFVELPETFDSTFFQCAPPAQRLPQLVGGDTIVLDNLFPGHRRLTIRLPSAQVTGNAHMEGRVAPIRFTFDTVFIDAERHRCTLLWRGRVAASKPDALERTRAVVELNVIDAGSVEGDMPPPWQQPEVSSAASVASKFEGTVSLGATAIREAAASPAMPFAAAPSAAARARTPRAAIPGAPWAGGRSEAQVLAAPADLSVTVAHQEPSSTAPAVEAEAAPLDGEDERAELAAAEERRRLEAEALDSERAELAAAEERRRLEAEALEIERKKDEQAAAEERRRREAERFEEEQRAAAKAAAEREAREAAARRQANKKIKTAMYGRFEDKK